MEKRETKSPIKDLPVRQPGQSIREQIAFLLDEDFMPYFLAVACLTLLACMELAATWFEISRQPWLFTAMALLAILLMLRKAVALKKWAKLNPNRLKYQIVFADGDVIPYDQLKEAREFAAKGDRDS